MQDTAIVRKFWSPSVTTQFTICPVPFHMDTYRGCTYGCLFCFARDFIQFARRRKDDAHRVQAYIEGNDPKALSRWIERTMAKEYDYGKAEEVAFKERIPLKIGATADPFPMVERRERITHDCLVELGKIDYPVQISTKNPEILLEYADEFVGYNMAPSVSCSFCDDDVAAKIEPGAISPTRRFAAIEKLAERGFRVNVRIQPFILPYADDNAERFVKKVRDSGASGIITEGLKIRVILPEQEKMMYGKIGEALGMDLLAEFKRNGVVSGGDRMYSEDAKRRFLGHLDSLCSENGIRFYNGDNICGECYGSGSECCGTEFLRNHKIWGGCTRSVAFKDDASKSSAEFGKCLVNFTRSKANSGRTVAEVCNEHLAKAGLPGIPFERNGRPSAELTANPTLEPVDVDVPELKPMGN